MSNKQDEHHGIPTSRGGSDHYINKKPINKKYHANYHAVFQNCTPAEAIAQIVMQHRDIFSAQFMDEISYVLAMPPEDMFLREAFCCDQAIENLQSEQKKAMRQLLEWTPEVPIEEVAEPQISPNPAVETDTPFRVVPNMKTTKDSHTP